jgi:hypothetical protein
MPIITIDEIKNRRDRHNHNNITRTTYYLEYYFRHPEVPWTLLAAGTSRNAGYQMSDLVRFHIYQENSGLAGEFIPFRHLFAFLEAGNFLIFHDVAPSLIVYEWAKVTKATIGEKNAAFKQLEHLDIDADPFIIERWQSFFDYARAQGYHTDVELAARTWPSDAKIRKHSFALIVNEQNQIEDRLVQDPNRYFRSIGGASIDVVKFIKLLNCLELTHLVYPRATSVNTDAHKLMMYTVGDFSSLDRRIRTGHDLYVGLFGRTSQANDPAVKQKRGEMINWVIGRGRMHHGTRMDYAPSVYDMDRNSAFLPFGMTFSPPLDRVNGGEEPYWPEYPGEHRELRHIHAQSDRLALGCFSPPRAIACRKAADVKAWINDEPITVPNMREVNPSAQLETDRLPTRAKIQLCMRT